jgi:hypothetical protein
MSVGKSNITFNKLCPPLIHDFPLPVDLLQNLSLSHSLGNRQWEHSRRVKEALSHKLHPSTTKHIQALVGK